MEEVTIVPLEVEEVNEETLVVKIEDVDGQSVDEVDGTQRNIIKKKRQTTREVVQRESGVESTLMENLPQHGEGVEDGAKNTIVDEDVLGNEVIV